MKCIVIFVAISWFFFFLPQSAVAEATLVINEFSPHPSSGNNEWIEIYNPERKELSGYWLDDDTSFAEDLGSEIVPLTTIVTEGSYSLVEVERFLNNEGDVVVLFDANGTIIDHYEYAEDPGVDITIGRSPNATGDFTILSSATRGSTNSNPKPTETPEPTPTIKPTSTPKPPTPTKPAKVSSKPDADESSDTDEMENEDEFLEEFESDDSFRVSGVPTAILGVSTRSADKKAAAKKTEKKKGTKGEVKDFRGDKNGFPVAGIAVSVGGVLLLSCAVVIYLKKRKTQR